MATLNWNHLRVFAAIAENGGVTRAAQALGMSQSAVSQTLLRLETAMDRTLVRREGRGFSLTPMGEAMDEDGDGFRYATNGSGESASWGLCDAAGMMPEEAMGWRVYFGVESTEQALAKVQELGGSVLDGPIDSPFGRITTIADPEGASFQISAMGEAISEG